MEVEVLGSTESRSFGDEIYAFCVRAFQGPPHHGFEIRETFPTNWRRQLGREGFRLSLVRTEPGTDLAGFLYGYHGRPGTWWFDTVTAALTSDTRQRWFDDCFEIVSMAVDPDLRGLGLGSAMLRKALEVASARTVVPSTHRDHNPAVRLDLREGFGVVVPGIIFAKGGPPFVVMARDVSSARTPTRGSSMDGRSA